MIDSPSRHLAGWAAELGTKRRVREEAASELATSERESTARMTAAALKRWSGIAGVIRQLVAAYNAGVNDEVLTVMEERGVPDRPTIKITSRANEGPFLSAGLEGTLIALCTRDGDAVSCQTEHRLRSDRDDDRTAAYLVKNWMERL
jgi:hypothetical protein